MLYLIAYDISVDARRTELAELLEGFGQRVQRCETPKSPPGDYNSYPRRVM
jgi:hypothetical protein